MSEIGWVKNLLICFDDIALLLPVYMAGSPEAADPVLAGPLLDMGLLKIIEPEWFVDREVTEQVAEAIIGLITDGAFDGIDTDAKFAELSMSRMGLSGSNEVYEMVKDELTLRGLAQPSRDGLSLPLHPLVRRSYLLLLAQAARHAGKRHGMNLHPITNRSEVWATLGGTLKVGDSLHKGAVVQFDLETVGLDLGDVPLDEVLAFKQEHGEEHGRYMRSLRQFVGELTLAGNSDEQAELYRERAEELSTEAARLKSQVRESFNLPGHVGGFGVGLLGVGWAAVTGDSVGLGLGLGGLGFGLYSLLRQQDHGSVYSYLFSVQQNMPYLERP